MADAKQAIEARGHDALTRFSLFDAIGYDSWPPKDTKTFFMSNQMLGNELSAT